MQFMFVLFIIQFSVKQYEATFKHIGYIIDVIISVYVQVHTCTYAVQYIVVAMKLANYIGGFLTWLCERLVVHNITTCIHVCTCTCIYMYIHII